MSGQTVECVACGHVGTTKTKGSFLITLILLCFGFLPGIIYEIWRRGGGKVCSACGSSNVKLYIPKPRTIQSSSNPVNPTREISNSKLVAHDSFSYAAGERIQTDHDGYELKLCPFCSESIRKTAIKCKHCGTMLETDANSN